jgi:NADH-quinone oxidoreductase subunit M
LILSLLIGLPITGALLAGLFPWAKVTKTLAFLVSLAVFILSLRLYAKFDLSDAGFQFKELYSLVPNLGIHYSVGIDGISLWLILLTTFLVPWVVLAGFGSFSQKGYYACILLLESAVIGTLASTDLFLFYLFWELMLIPAFFLIGVWGGNQRIKATIKFVLYTMFGSLLMLVGLLYITHEAKSFDYVKIADHFFSEDAQFWCFLAFALAFLIKIPMFPLHGWLPEAYVEAPTGGTVLLSAVMVKLGVYGLLRFCIPFFPSAAKAFAPWIMILAVAGVLHGALMATFQTNFKGVLAYSSLSHMGLILLGIFTFSLTGLQGGVLQMAAHGVYMAGLFLLAGMLNERRLSYEMADFGGWAKTTPILAVLFMVMMVAALGMPGFAGFVGEILILVSAYKANAVLALIAISGFVLSAWYFFYLYGKIFLGPTDKKQANPLDLSAREIILLLPLAAAVVGIGLAPNFFLRPMEKSLQANVIERLKPAPAMTDFAANQRHLQDEMEKEKKGRR